MEENSNFWQRFINATKRATSSKRISQLKVYFDMKKTSAELFSQKLEYQRCFRTQLDISGRIF